MVEFNMKMFYKFIGSAILIVWFSNLCAQDVKVSAHMDSTVITIGDQVTCKLQITAPSDYSLLWPTLHDTIITGVEIVRRSKIDTLAQTESKNRTLSQKLIITSFDSGYYALPPFVFSYKKPGDTTLYTIETEAILMSVNSVAVDTAQPIKPIKGPLSAPYTLKEALPWIIAGIFVAGLIFLFFYIRKRRKMAKPIIPVHSAPPIPDYELALRELERLRGEKVWQRGLIKEYHTQLTDILRQYIDNHYGIQAQEMTSDEIIEKLNRLAVNRLAMNKLTDILFLADLVKFAKAQPLPADHDVSMNNAFEFVKSTIIKPESLNPVASETGNPGSKIVTAEKSKLNN